MKYFALFLFLTSLSFSLSSQNYINEYISDEILILRDDPNIKAYKKNDQLIIETIHEDFVQPYVENLTQLNTCENFEISSTFKIIGSQDEKCYLIWGSDISASEYFVFGYSNNGVVEIARDSKNRIFNYEIFSDTLHHNILKNEPNNLKIVKIDNQYSFYVNEELVHEEEFDNFKGNESGWLINIKHKIEIDFYKAIEISPDIPIIEDYSFFKYNTPYIVIFFIPILIILPYFYGKRKSGKNSFRRIKFYLFINKIGSAIDELHEIKDNFPLYESEIIIIGSRHNGLEQDIIKGIINKEKSDKANNDIKNSIQKLIGQMKRSNDKKYLPFITVCIIASISFNYNSNYFPPSGQNGINSFICASKDRNFIHNDSSIVLRINSKRKRSIGEITKHYPSQHLQDHIILNNLFKEINKDKISYKNKNNIPDNFAMEDFLFPNLKALQIETGNSPSIINENINFRIVGRDATTDKFKIKASINKSPNVNKLKLNKGAIFTSKISELNIQPIVFFDTDDSIVIKDNGTYWLIDLDNKKKEFDIYAYCFIDGLQAPTHLDEIHLSSFKVDPESLNAINSCKHNDEYDEYKKKRYHEVL